MVGGLSVRSSDSYDFKCSQSPEMQMDVDVMVWGQGQGGVTSFKNMDLDVGRYDSDESEKSNIEKSDSENSANSRKGAVRMMMIV